MLLSYIIQPFLNHTQLRHRTHLVNTGYILEKGKTPPCSI